MTLASFATTYPNEYNWFIETSNAIVVTLGFSPVRCEYHLTTTDRYGKPIKPVIKFHFDTAKDLLQLYVNDILALEVGPNGHYVLVLKDIYVGAYIGKPKVIGTSLTTALGSIISPKGPIFQFEPFYAYFFKGPPGKFHSRILRIDSSLVGVIKKSEIIDTIEAIWKDDLRPNKKTVLFKKFPPGKTSDCVVFSAVSGASPTGKPVIPTTSPTPMPKPPTHTAPPVAVKLSYPLNQILYGPPGTGKTYSTQSKALDIIGVTPAPGSLSTTFNSNLIKGWSLKGQIAFCTFHQNFAYEDFIEGIKPITSGGAVSYRIEDGIFKKLCERAKLNPELNYVLIIDEINRGNVSSIFGELITLIEDNKRDGEPNELSVILPYSKKAFSVPNNVYLIGTMNTADRSVEALDVALRRRFVFEEMLPDPSLLRGKKIGTIDLEILLRTINQRLEIILDKDHTIGHAFFLNVSSRPELKAVFKQKVIPLFQEYFFGDIIKIALALHHSFLEEIDPKAVTFKPFPSKLHPSTNLTSSLVADIHSKDYLKIAKDTVWDLEKII